MNHLLITIFFFAKMGLYDSPEAVWVTPTTHDFGTLKHRTAATVDFKFKNSGDAPLLIDNVRSLCGCTATDWTETPVPPGKEGFIHVEFDARKQGYFYKKVTVFFNGQRKGQKLYLEGFVE
jgi:hypothetical protein